MVCKALENEFWVSQINTQDGLSMEHISQFVNLWEMIDGVQLQHDIPDTILWKLNNNGLFSSQSAYKMQFLVHTSSTMPALVWKSWAPPKYKIFTWLILQNRIWTADRLTRRGWPNCGRCKLCNQVQETSPHLLFQCRFTTRIWSLLKTWLGLHDIAPRNWQALHTIKDWWTTVIHKKGLHGKAMATLAMLILSGERFGVSAIQGCFETIRWPST